jgi:CRP/FNR family cyclic AMP-dependent transcriptional regulator
METLERILGAHPFFDGLEPTYLTLLVGCATNVRFDDGRFVFRAGEEANHFYLLRAGTVALEIAPPGRTPLIVETLAAGDILGWSWLIPPYHWMFDARAVGLTRAIALDGKCLRTKCEADHDLGYELLKRFAHIMEQRLQATRLQLLDVYGDARDVAG